MSGRAGRRGKDERGICIIMIDEQVILSLILVECDYIGYQRNQLFPSRNISIHLSLPIIVM